MSPSHWLTDAFERDDLGSDLVQLILGVERILGHEPLQKIDVALKAPRSLVQAGGFRAVLYPGDILRAPDFDSDDDQAQAQHRDSEHALLSIPIYRADITIFDPDDFRDEATYASRYPSGARTTVIVNGTVVIEKAAHTGATPGIVMRRSADGSVG